MRDDYYPEIRPYVYAVGEMALLAGEVEVQLYDMARLLGIEAAERFTVGRLIPQLKTARWTVELAAWSDVDRRELEIWLDRVNTAMEGRNGILHSSKIWETAEDGAKIRSRTVHRDGTVRPEDIRKVEKITDRLAAARERAIPLYPNTSGDGC